MIKGYRKKDNKIIEATYQNEQNKIAVDVLYCGICGTDYQKYIGMDNVEEWGHEIIGKVNNDLVAIRTTYPCGTCDSCNNNHPEKCNNWTRINMNGFSEKI